MLELVLGLGLIVLLYARTFTYNHLIDDAVPMSGYLYNVPVSAPAPGFYMSKSPWWARVLAISCHMMNTWLVYLLLGGKAALLFAVFPVSVNNVAWITGSYYSCTTLLTLSSFYFFTHTPWMIGAPIGAAIFALALNTTIATIAYPFVFLFGHPIGLVTILPLLGFFKGKRFTTGCKIREGNFDKAKITPDVYTLGRFAFSVKLLALYLWTAIYPIRLVFFRRFGTRYRVRPEEKAKLDAFDGWFVASVLLLVSWLLVGFLVGKLFWAMWFCVMLAAFCQIKMLGQVFAERYMYPASVGFCAVLASLPDPMLWALVGLYVMRTHMFIPVWASNKTIYENGVALDGEPSNYCNLADWYLMQEVDYSLAGWYAQKHIQLEPDDFKGYVNFASLWRRLGNYENALKFIKLAKNAATGKASEYIHTIIDRQTAWIKEEVKTGQPYKVPVDEDGKVIAKKRKKRGKRESTKD